MGVDYPVTNSVWLLVLNLHTHTHTHTHTQKLYLAMEMEEMNVCTCKYCFFVGGGATCKIDATLDKVIPTFLHVGDNIIP